MFGGFRESWGVIRGVSGLTALCLGLALASCTKSPERPKANGAKSAKPELKKVLTNPVSKTVDEKVGSLSPSDNNKLGKQDSEIRKQDTQSAKQDTKSEASAGRDRGASKPSPSADKGPARPFEVSILRVAIQGVDENETAMSRTVRFSVTACVTDVSHDVPKPAIDVDFTVQNTAGQTVPVRTLRDSGLEGCLRWDERIAHKYYEPEHFLVKSIVIRHASGFEERRDIALNPWDRFGFGRDLKEDPAFIASVNGRQLAPSRLLIDSFGFDTIETREHQLDEFLNLTEIKRLRLRIPLRVQRHSSIYNGRNLPAEPLRDGIYVIRAAVEATFKDPTGQQVEMISAMRGGRRLIRVRGAEAKVDIDFPVRDGRLFKARGNIFLEILPIQEEKLPKKALETLQSDGLDLDSLIDRESGLAAPTYVGAIWMREEGASVILYPTDDLNANPAIDGTGARGPGVETMRAYAGMTLDRLLQRKAELDRRLNDQMRANATLFALATSGNLEYVPLTHEDAIIGSDSRLQTWNRYFPSKAASEKFLKALNAPMVSLGEGFPKLRLEAPVTRDTLLELVEGRRDLDRAMAERLCVVFFKELIPSVKPGANERGYSPFPFIDMCGTELQDGVREVFTLDRKLRVFEAGQPKQLPGKSLIVGVGADVSFGSSNSRSMSMGSSLGAGWSPMKMLGGLIGDIPGLEILSLASGLGVSFNAGVNVQTSQSMGQGSSFGADTKLNMEEVNLLIPFKRYESCAALRVSPAFWERHARSIKYFSETLAGGEVNELWRILSRGVLVCSGYQNKTPVEKVESYYSFAQGSFDETQLDRGDLINHPWFMAFRGQPEYWQFMKLLEARRKGSGDIPQTVNVGSLPLDRLEDAYNAYRGSMHTMPGTYTVEVEIPERKPGFFKSLLNKF